MPGMCLPRASVRRLMLLVALSALGTLVAREFRHGSPPEFVVRGIPARVHRLRPGMTWGETRDILGLERHWLRGGTSAEGGGGLTDGPRASVLYFVGGARGGLQRPGAPQPPSYPPRGVIHLSFMMGAGGLAWRASPATRLLDASLHADGRVVAQMAR